MTNQEAMAERAAFYRLREAIRTIQSARWWPPNASKPNGLFYWDITNLQTAARSLAPVAIMLDTYLEADSRRFLQPAEPLDSISE